MILSLALALTLTADSQGNVDISEQQLTQYVNNIRIYLPIPNNTVFTVSPNILRSILKL